MRTENGSYWLLQISKDLDRRYCCIVVSSAGATTGHSVRTEFIEVVIYASCRILCGHVRMQVDLLVGPQWWLSELRIPVEVSGFDSPIESD